MFGRVTTQQVIHHFNKAKDVLRHAYNQTRNFLGNLDHGVRTDKQVHGAIAPVFESYSVNPGNKTMMKAVTGYDTIRGHVMTGQRPGGE
jgi:hypothetical protein